MKKLVALFTVLLMAAGITLGCGKTEPAKVDPGKKVLMKIGHAQPTSHPRHQSLLKFKEIVEQKSAKQIEVQIFASGQLGSEAEQMEAVKMGTIQATRGGQFEAAAPELLIYTMPFLFNDIESVHKITRGPIGEKIAKHAEKNGITIIATGDAGGLRHITNNTRPIVKPEDMQGLKLRTPPIESIIKTMAAFGANPVSIPYTEVYMALKTGVADGQENPLVNITAMKFYEVQKYLTLVNYQYHPDPFYVSSKWFKALDPKHQAILIEAAKETMKYNDELVDKETKASLATLEKAMKVNNLTKEQRQLFIDKAKPVYDYYIGKGLFTMKDLDEIRNAAK